MRRIKKAWPLVVVLAVSIFGIAAWPYFSGRADLGIQKKPRIKQLIYPTFGNPAIIKKGTVLTVEFDPRDRRFDKSFLPVKVFTVSARSTNDPYPVTMDLPVKSIEVGVSRQWPEYGGVKGEDRRIYLVGVEVPQALPEDLYDLTASASRSNGTSVSDSQPHALKAVDQYKDRFSFCQLTDIHVYGPECDYPSANYHLRSERSDGKDPERKGAVYYQKAIEQINLMRPDFCVLTGDFMFGQSYFLQDQDGPWGLTTEYEYEMLWFYEETLRMDVPVFLLMGNHECFSEDDEAAKEDWFDNWRRLYGPLYHSFDYGDYHFLALNSQDWPVEERTLVDYGVSIQSDKYKGQFSGGGDRWSPGVSVERLEGVDESRLTGQLRWMRDDLRGHQGSKMRVVATHQEPWRQEGSGVMWASAGADTGGFIGQIKSLMGFAGVYGNGEGRLAAIKLMSENKVALEISGHFHSDFVEAFPWADKSGRVLSVNTTCTQFNVDGLSRSYPGYRRIWINNGTVESFNYADPMWSYPIYKGTNVGGVTDLGMLVHPAIESSFSPSPGSSRTVTLTIENSLKKPLPGAYAEFPMPFLSKGYYYEVKNGSVAQTYDDDDKSPEHRVYQVYTDVAPGEVKKVQVVESAAPDLAAPVGGLSINGGVQKISSLAVTLDIEASDPGGAGIKDMMISNTPDFKGAEWQTYSASATWSLADGSAGNREVYVKFRDYAMPANVSGVAQVSIIYYPQ